MVDIFSMTLSNVSFKINFDVCDKRHRKFISLGTIGTAWVVELLNATFVHAYMHY